MTDGVTRRYEFSATRAVILDIVITNISDPLTGQEARTSTDHWIFSGFPNPADLGKPAPKGWKFPIVVIEFPTVEAINSVVDGSKDLLTNTVRIECHSRTRLEAQELAEQILYILKVTGQTELRKAALHGPDMIGSTNERDFIGGNKYYSKNIELEFMRFD